MTFRLVLARPPFKASVGAAGHSAVLNAKSFEVPWLAPRRGVRDGRRRVRHPLHGFSSCIHNRRFNLDHFVMSHRVPAIEMRGFGVFEKPRDGAYDVESHTTHLFTFPDGLER